MSGVRDDDNLITEPAVRLRGVDHGAPQGVRLMAGRGGDLPGVVVVRAPKPAARFGDGDDRQQERGRIVRLVRSGLLA